MYSLTGVTSIVLNMVTILFANGDSEAILNLVVILLIAQMMLGFVRFIYTIRVFSGLIQVYGLRKRWIWLCLISYTRWLPMLIWGFNPKYQPEWKVEDIQAELARLASSGSARRCSTRWASCPRAR